MHLQQPAIMVLSANYKFVSFWYFSRIVSVNEDLMIKWRKLSDEVRTHYEDLCRDEAILDDVRNCIDHGHLLVYGINQHLFAPNSMNT